MEYSGCFQAGPEGVKQVIENGLKREYETLRALDVQTLSSLKADFTQWYNVARVSPEIQAAIGWEIVRELNNLINAALEENVDEGHARIIRQRRKL